MTELVRTRRVAFADGPVEAGYGIRDARWKTEGLVNDLITQEAFDNANQTTFEADLHLRVPLRKFALEI